VNDLVVSQADTTTSAAVVVISSTTTDDGVTYSAANTSTPVYGQNLTLVATIAATSPGSGLPTGTVTFYDGTTTIGTTRRPTAPPSPSRGPSPGPSTRKHEVADTGSSPSMRLGKKAIHRRRPGTNGSSRRTMSPSRGPGINDPFHASAFSVTLVLAIETSPDIEQGSPSRVDASAWFKSDGGRVTNAMGARA
jgi:hypothetical protein